MKKIIFALIILSVAGFFWSAFVVAAYDVFGLLAAILFVVIPATLIAAVVYIIIKKRKSFATTHEQHKVQEEPEAFIEIPESSTDIPSQQDNIPASASSHLNFGNLGDVDWGYVSEQEIFNLKQYIVLDVETTGFSPTEHRIIEVAAIKYADNQIVDRFESLVNPLSPIPAKITSITKITDADVKNAPTFNEIAPKLLDFIDDLPVIAHNASFDANFIEASFEREGYVCSFDCIDTLDMAREAFPNLKSHKLSVLIDALNLSDEEQAHRALSDAEATQKLFVICREKLIAARDNYFKKMIKKAERAPHNEKSEIYCTLGFEYERIQDIDNLIFYFEKSVELKHPYPYPYLRLAINYRRLKRYRDEVRVCQSALLNCSCNDEEVHSWQHRISVAMQKMEKSKIQIK